MFHFRARFLHIVSLFSNKPVKSNIQIEKQELLFNRSVVSDSLWPHGLQHDRSPCPSLSPRVCSNSCPLISDAIQPPHSLLSPSLPSFNFSQHQSPSQVSSSHQVAKILELQLQRQSCQWIFRAFFTINWLGIFAVQGTLQSLLQVVRERWLWVPCFMHRTHIGYEKKGGAYWMGRIHVCLWPIHADVWQKPPQHCKVVILQLK